MESIKLKNGMTLCHEYDPSVALITADLWIKVGAGDEPKELAGASHFLEHMIFKGTDKLGPGDYDAIVEEAGGYLNAGTSYDYTHYYINVPSPQFERVFEAFADSMLNSVIDENETNMERQVILEEISRKSDSPFGFLFDDTFCRLYNDGPYRHPVIGSPETVKALSADQLRDHYHRYYVPGRMTLCLVGDLDREQAVALANRYFGDYCREFRPWLEQWQRPVFAAPEERFTTRDWQECYFIYTFMLPPISLPHESAVGELVSTLLTGGRNSRLVKNVQEKQQLVSFIDASLMTGRSDMPFIIYGACPKENALAVRASIDEVLSTLNEEGPNEQEIPRVRQMTVNGYLYGLETCAARAQTAAYSMIMNESLDLYHELGEHLEAITPEELAVFAKEYLVPEKGSFFLAGPALGNDA